MKGNWQQNGLPVEDTYNGVWQKSWVLHNELGLGLIGMLLIKLTDSFFE